MINLKYLQVVPGKFKNIANRSFINLKLYKYVRDKFTIFVGRSLINFKTLQVSLW